MDAGFEEDHAAAFDPVADLDLVPDPCLLATDDEGAEQSLGLGEMDVREGHG